jgi:protein required for attachment to host cells
MGEADMAKSSGVAATVLSGEVWVVVADAGRARLFGCKHANDTLRELEDLLNPEQRLQAHKSDADRSGHAVRGTAPGGQSFEPRQTRAESNAQQFARTIAQHLEEAHQQGRVGRIYLIAEAAFLGQLRPQLSPMVRTLVQEEIASDLTRHPLTAIREVLPKHL